MVFSREERKGAKDAKEMTENEIAKIVVDLSYKIHRLFGPGLFESVYEELLCYELTKLNISFTRQHPVPLVHETVELQVGFRADIIVERKVMVEINQKRRWQMFILNRYIRICS